MATWGLLVLPGQSTVEVRNEILEKIARIKSLETEKTRHEAKLSQLQIELTTLSEQGMRLSSIIAQAQHEIAYLEEVKTRQTS